MEDRERPKPIKRRKQLEENRDYRDSRNINKTISILREIRRKYYPCETRKWYYIKGKLRK